MTPTWLAATEATLGPPDFTTRAAMTRWTWDEGDRGILIDQRGTGDLAVFQIVAWIPERSVTVRCVSPPDDETCARTLDLVGLSARELAPR